MRDLSEALPLVEQAEAALDVLDKKDRGTGGSSLVHLTGNCLQRTCN